MTSDISLISLAAWLHRQAEYIAEQPEAASEFSSAETNGTTMARQAAARLEQASRVVKEAADRQRQEQGKAAPRPAAANEA